MTTEPPAGSIACPRCGAAVGPEQDWCLECGAPARTRLVAASNWRAPIAVIVAVLVLAAGGLAAAFVALTDDDGRAGTTTTAPATAAPAAAPPATTPVAP